MNARDTEIEKETSTYGYFRSSEPYDKLTFAGGTYRSSLWGRACLRMLSGGNGRS